jgi:superfamily II DNA/RNA helicase
MDRRDAAIADSLLDIGVTSLKEKQLEAIHAFLDERDTFVSLPTGYRKSLIYSLIFDKLRGQSAKRWQVATLHVLMQVQLEAVSFASAP